MKKDLVSLLSGAHSIAAAVRTTSVNGTGVDLAGFNSAVVLFAPGALTDGVHTPSVEESDASGSGYTAVAAADLIGSLGVVVANTPQAIGYKGTKRYVRAVVTTTGSPSTGAVVGATVVRGDAIKQPAA